MIKTKLTRKQILETIETEERRAWEILKIMEDSPAMFNFRSAWSALYNLKRDLERNG